MELNNRLKTDFEEISGKYAEMIGHQNPKQRIKHVAQLKDKIYQLEQVRWLVVLFFAVLLYFVWDILMALDLCYY